MGCFFFLTILKNNVCFSFHDKRVLDNEKNIPLRFLYMMYLNFVGAEDTGIIKAVKCQLLHSSGTRTGNVNLPKFVSQALFVECL